MAVRGQSGCVPGHDDCDAVFASGRRPVNWWLEKGSRLKCDLLYAYGLLVEWG